MSKDRHCKGAPKVREEIEDRKDRKENQDRKDRREIKG